MSKWRKKNRKKYNQWANDWYKKNKKKVLKRAKRHALWTNYRLTEEAFLRLLTQQKYKCKICQKKFKGRSLDDRRKGDVYVDHNHSTGKARGLLCPPCNTFVGHIENKPELVAPIRRYLRAA